MSGWAAARAVSGAEIAAGVADDDNDGAVVIPDETGGAFLYIWRSDEAGGDPTAVSVGPAPNWRNFFGAPVPMALGDVPGQVIVTVARQDAGLLSGETIEITDPDPA